MNRDNRQTMLGSDLKRLRKALGLSVDAFAIELGYEGSKKNNCTTIRRFEAGKRGIPLTLAKLAWMIDQHGLPEQWPEHLEAKLENEECSG